MNPQATATPQPVTTNPQGAASITPIAQPTPQALPQGQAPAPVQQDQLANQNIQPQTAATLGAIAQYYNIPRQTAAITGAGQSQAGVASGQFEHQKAENQINISNQQAMLNPQDYQFVKNPNGTVSVLNVLGQQVSIGQYAQLTGANPAEALQNAGATDPNDQKFIAAYNNFQTFVQDKIAAQNGDTQAQAELQDFYKNNPGLDGLELGQLQTAFTNQYGAYLGISPQSNGGGLGQIGASPTLQSANNPLTTSPYENLEYYGTQEANNPYAVGFGNPSATYTGASPGSTSSASSLANELSQLNTSGQ